MGGGGGRAGWEGSWEGRAASPLGQGWEPSPSLQRHVACRISESSCLNVAHLHLHPSHSSCICVSLSFTLPSRPTPLEGFA